MRRKKTCSLISLTIISFSFLFIFNEQALAQNASECEDFARDYARRESRRGGGLIRGAARGSIRAGIAGDIVGDNDFARDAARVGAVIGGISGGSRRRRNRDELYDMAFEDCMSNSYGRPTPY